MAGARRMDAVVRLACIASISSSRRTLTWTRTCWRTGALDISVVSDLPLFVDPFLLFNSENAEYQALGRRDPR